MAFFMAIIKWFLTKAILPPSGQMITTGGFATGKVKWVKSRGHRCSKLFTLLRTTPTAKG